MRNEFAAFLAFLLPLGATAASVQTFNLPNGEATCGLGIADDGTVVGNNQATSGQTMVNFVYSNETFTYPAPKLPAGQLTLTGINARHVIAGWDLSTNSGSIGFKLKGNAAKVLSVNGAFVVAATSINDAGSVVGWYLSDSGYLGFIDHSGSITTINSGATYTLPSGINRAGTIVVGTSLQTPTMTAWIYQNGSFTTIAVPGASATVGGGVYGKGVVTGTYFTGTGANEIAHGYIYRGGRYRSFDVPGATATQISGANEHGQFTGCYTDTAGTHGFIATP